MNGANQYKQMAVKTAHPGQILIMLYEAAIRNVKKAINCIDQNDIAGKGQAIVKTHDIVNELMNTLNFDIGGQVARDLERLYGFMSEQLLRANLNNTKEPLEGVLKSLETLLSAWKIAVAEVQRAQAKGISAADISVSQGDQKPQQVATASPTPQAPTTAQKQPVVTSGTNKPIGIKGI